ncbi:MAG: MarR family transcriptional regulator [Gordonia sp. (in: high G+C Gram-positive bacteria)]|uniref:MarR family winged helix-turn-helix transcriptional regulator n=1 Tax=Gordonia sp. (in: high G+C Gram-positive bacteria) TaxID=84139 RepID=UPI0039E35148
MSKSREAGIAQAAIDLRSVVARIVRHLREAGADDQITPSQASALSRLGRAGIATTSALAAGEKVRPQSMAATVEALEQMGLVTRRPDPTDGRRQLITLTDAGHARLDGNRAAVNTRLEQTLSQLSTDELATVREATAILERVLT